MFLKEDVILAANFLQGGGEMGELTRRFDWSRTPLGAIDGWPHSLRITVSNLLRSKFPMFLWWGEEMIQFYNDAYRPSLGNNGKHPTALGQRGRECWPEIWDIISPLIKQVQATGEGTWREDQLVPIFRNGQIEEVYWTFSYSSVQHDNGSHGGILVTCVETTEKVLNRKKVEQSENNLCNVILQAPVAMCILKGPAFIVEIANDRVCEIWGKTAKQVLGKPIFEAIPEAKDQGFGELLDQVYRTGETVRAFSVPLTLPRGGKLNTVYINFVYEAFRESDGSISGIMAVASEVTEQVNAIKEIEKSEASFRLLADSMPQFVWTSDPQGNIYYFNQAVFNYAGLSEGEIQNDGWLQIVHPDDREANSKLWMHSIETGEDFVFHHRFRNKDGEYRWQLSRAVPLRDSEGRIQRWVGTSTDIHDQKLFEEELQRRVQQRTTRARKSK